MDDAQRDYCGAQQNRCQDKLDKRFDRIDSILMSCLKQNVETLERLGKLETKVCLKFEELDRALVLARELASSERLDARATLNDRLKGMNEFQKRMDRLEATFATRDDIKAVADSLAQCVRKDEFAVLQKFMYIAIGGLIVIQIGLRFLL